MTGLGVELDGAHPRAARVVLCGGVEIRIQRHARIALKSIASIITRSVTRGIIEVHEPVRVVSKQIARDHDTLRADALDRVSVIAPAVFADVLEQVVPDHHP